MKYRVKMKVEQGPIFIVQKRVFFFFWREEKRFSRQSYADYYIQKQVHSSHG